MVRYSRLLMLATSDSTCPRFIHVGRHAIRRGPWSDSGPPFVTRHWYSNNIFFSVSTLPTQPLFTIFFTSKAFSKTFSVNRKSVLLFGFLPFRFHFCRGLLIIVFCFTLKNHGLNLFHFIWKQIRVLIWNSYA